MLYFSNLHTLHQVWGSFSKLSENIGCLISSYRNQSEIDGHFNGNNAYHSTFGNGNTTNNGRITNKVYLFAQRSKEYTPHPLIWMVPYCRNPDFIGRKSIIKRMNEISEGQGHNRIALYGLGGAG
ncbi:hypothetical protein L873DRAFT_488465 [Choiromyces venosus 120613-1]|uniref:Uncharacterized protein n=1 Tax=Choiromyces venosus 120613-1 TaxID=1336337 RepID=A0A3N4JUU7_9PEZI|nr:hypothetical protein L873DRAFT_488465 [Choiromyces venosus 120613-1]